ncbi:5'-nucleotidase C-terminal domain-containing protein [Tessaracoccus flavus]|nr:5'-nucleotidase C-terminal domain-containing protein [Tessaracoccus flavus]
MWASAPPRSSWVTSSFLEYSAKYFGTVAAGDTFDPEADTSVVYAGQKVPDYNSDILAGINYEIDLSQPVGSRIENLTMPDGSAVADDDQFVVALNNYRRSGGGNFPHVSTAPVVYNDLLEIRQLLIDWAVEKGTIDPADFYVPNWTLTVDGVPVP